MRTLRVLAFVVLAAVVLGACGGGGVSDPSATRAERATQEPGSTVAAAAAPSANTLRANSLQAIDGLVATARGALPVFASPDVPEPGSTLEAHTDFGSPTTVRVVAWEGYDGAWLEVLLPVRPNDSRGYVRADDVALARVGHAVEVDLADRTLRVVGTEGVVLETPVATGSPENPTPAGDFFVTDVIDTGDDDSDYGRIAIGVSAHSESLSEFGGGDGQIGIHGTNQPSSIGMAVSHGCVRVPNDVAVQLATLLPLGTPVMIH